jgi:hypothetical protein
MCGLLYRGEHDRGSLAADQHGQYREQGDDSAACPVDGSGANCRHRLCLGLTDPTRGTPVAELAERLEDEGYVT